MISEGGAGFHDKAKQTMSVGGDMSVALEITLKVQLQELKQWDSPAFQFMHLICLLPTFNYMSDLKNYWK